VVTVGGKNEKVVGLELVIGYALLSYNTADYLKSVRVNVFSIAGIVSQSTTVCATVDDKPRTEHKCTKYKPEAYDGQSTCGDEGED
jgi:hypothetical protein